MDRASKSAGEGAPEVRNRRDDLRKYLSYFFETRGFTTGTEVGSVSPSTVAAARFARGSARGPAIFLQGIMPRSGTVYVGELLRRHPDVCAYPHQLWEFPALVLADQAHRLRAEFLYGYRMNQGKLADEDFLPLLGGGLMAWLHSAAPPDQRVLVKMPSVQYLSHFFTMFPHEHLLVLVRDGRDVVHSTLRTWRNLNFLQVCLRWNRSARSVLNHREMMARMNRQGYWLARFEDALAAPEEFVSEACWRFDLEPQKYPYSEIENIRVIGSSKLEKGQVSWRHLKAPKEFRPAGYWQKWSPLKKSVFKVIAGRSLVRLGYSQDLDW